MPRGARRDGADDIDGRRDGRGATDVRDDGQRHEKRERVSERASERTNEGTKTQRKPLCSALTTDEDEFKLVCVQLGLNCPVSTTRLATGSHKAQPQTRSG